MADDDLLSGFNPQAAATSQQPSPSVADNPPLDSGDLLHNFDPTTGGSKKKELGPAPPWSEVPGQAVSNLGHSGAEFAGNLATAAMHPIQTVQNLGSIGLGVMEKIGRHIGLPAGQGYEKYADAVGQMMVDRYGSEENIRRTLATDPVGVAADVSTLFTGAGGLAGKLPGIAGRIGEGVGAVGRVADPLNVITKPIGYGAGLAGSMGKHVLGERLGPGAEAIGEATSAGYKGGEPAREFRENIRQQVPLENVVDTSMDAIHNIVTEKN